ncbi:MAG: dienelactone hydrolase family protein [Dehalococcoidia bacterium]|jgi:alpha/beta superfamily hydrolase|uniref:Dienelactone hydrolase domain-containing protein n=1 Tax=marine metagenome TaxID=408172 RepID=A0A381S081_9ZZZZ|nr:hypothetical protein [Dehalococcoidia bacterium]MCH2312973.1 dienelactone hydrolase family protein [SAR202 cluster bacterium]MEC7913732.1 dienelactone hydrolase family protein [Chloroflexota bacterium]MBV46815.1 hypothetical protein [Dehalococcoidia bacterium]MCS5648554.1 dienelactone hydrolase family protein [Dehalococcoidia bacterium]|tara:strand:- start:8065 stop:8709 length:645 start_codon:yes stop_codon:yes gene_type:complete
MTDTTKELTTLSTGTSELESLLETPNQVKRPPCVILCHPHPQYGGNMFDGLINQISSYLLSNEIATLRFNQRGVGMSSGESGDGTNEMIDTEAVVNLISSNPKIDGSRLGIIGYSFGAWMALESSLRTNLIKSLVSIACPQNKFAQYGTVQITQPKLLILGDRDHDFTLGQFKFLANRMSEPKRTEVVTGADHFFREHRDLVGKLSCEFIKETL